MQIVYADLGLDPDPAAMAETADWLHDYTGELFEGGLPWCDGARNLLDAVAAAGIPMALVTNTRRALTEKALNSIGRHYFSVTVCGDEVTDGKPAPDPYLRAAELLGVDPADCLADRGLGDRYCRGRGAPDARCWWYPTRSRCPASLRRRQLRPLARTGCHGPARAYYAELGSGAENAPPDPRSVIECDAITQCCGKDASWPVTDLLCDDGHRFDEESEHGGRVVRIASVAALGGLLFGYDSAVINGAVSSIQEDFGIGNAETGLRGRVGAARRGRRRDDRGPDRRQDRPDIGDEDRRGVLP